MTLSTRRQGTAGALIAVSIALAACGTGSSDNSKTAAGGGGGGAPTLRTGPGVDASTKTLHVGVLSALSGPAAPLGGPYAAGLKTFWKAQNARGGIDGWKAKLTIKDDQYQPQPHVEAFNQIAPNIALLASFGSPTTKAIQPMVDQQKLVTLPLSWDSAWSKDPTLAAVGTPYSIDVANSIDYVVNKKGQKNAKFGIIYQNDEYGADGLRGYKAALKAYHFKDVARATYKVGDTEFTSQVQKMKNAGAQYVILTALPSVSGPVVGTGASLGYNPTWILQGPAWLEFLMSKDGTQKGAPTPIAKALEKSAWVMQISATWGDTSKPGMEQFLADAKQFAPKQIPDPYFVYGYVSGRIQSAILRKALADKDLSRAGIYAAKTSVGKIDLGGLMPDVEYTKTPAANSRATQLARVDANAPGFLKPLAGPFVGEVGKQL
jgi:ABC-type branched-subunit amino acid transport system substrate-binding protein